MAHQFIIYGLPDSILMLCMHLDTPREAFAYLKYRYGQIPRPEIQKTVDEAVQQHDMPSEQYMTGESAQSTCDSNNGPENLPGGHEDPVDSPNDCAETESGFLTPKTKVTDVRHVEPHLLVVEVGAMDSKWLDEGMDAPKALDEGSQCAGDEVEEGEDLPKPSSEAHKPQGDLPDTTSECAETQTGHRKPENEVVDTQQMVDVLPMFEVGTTGRTRHDKHVKELEASDEGGQCTDEVTACRDLPEPRSEALEPADNISRQAGGHSIESGLQIPSEDDQRMQTNGEMIANVPDPPSTHSEPSTPQIEHPTLLNRSSAQKRSAMTTEFDLSYTRTSDKLREAKCLELDSKQAPRCPRPTQAGRGYSMDIESKMTKLEIRTISTNMVESQTHLPHLERHPKELDKGDIQYLKKVLHT
ncbi:hypothetical protein F5141DRAFT_1250663 [Pisolithus sp. B1]|nr:hypothetical protein F5141DRAFT_1250663 [Pisolithus sp. B1]